MGKKVTVINLVKFKPFLFLGDDIVQSRVCSSRRKRPPEDSPLHCRLQQHSLTGLILKGFIIGLAVRRNRSALLMRSFNEVKAHKQLT